MKKIEGFVMRRLGKESMIVAESVELVEFDKIVSLNSSAAFVWDSLSDNDFSVETIAELLTDRYEVEREVARKDAEELAKVWLVAGIIKA